MSGAGASDPPASLESAALLPDANLTPKFLVEEPSGQMSITQMLLFAPCQSIGGQQT